MFFTLFLKKLDDCVTSSRVEEQDYFIAKVESILEKNYADMSLSVGMIAEELNMPMRLVSSQYKQKTGYGLLDRIHSFRVEKAGQNATVAKNLCRLGSAGTTVTQSLPREDRNPST